MNLALAKTDTARTPDDTFVSARDRLPGAGTIAETRQRAFEAYARAGLPHRRIEVSTLDVQAGEAGRGNDDDLVNHPS